MANGTQPATASAAPGGKAIKLGILRVIILGLISPFYGLYWFYHTRGVVTRELGTNDQVGLQTAGLFVPILNIFIYYWLLRDIDKLNRQIGGQGFPVPPVWMILGPVILAIIPLVNLLAGVLGLVVAILVLMRMNEVYDKKGATSKPFSGGEIAVVVLGIAFYILYFVVIAAALSGASQIQTTTPTY
jgi:multisubunit Na+/H+ antiporter MnhG subunit